MKVLRRVLDFSFIISRVEGTEFAIKFRWLIGFTVFGFSALLTAQPAEQVSRATFDQWMQDISNWGRWGDDDLSLIHISEPTRPY